MEKIRELLEVAILKLKSKDKIGVIKELTSLLLKKGVITDEEEFLKAILKRENLESTGIGFGVAIPHARTKSAKKLVLAFGRSIEGIDFSSIDGKPSYLVFLIAAPEDKKSEYILTLARLSKILRRENIRKKLREAKDKEEVLEIIERVER